MKIFKRTTLAIAVLGLLAMPLSLMAAGGNVVGTGPGTDPNIGDCDVSSLTFTGPSDGAGLFQFRSASTSDSRPAGNDIVYNLYGGSVTRVCTYEEAAGQGAWKCVNNSFTTPPTSDSQTVWAIATFYPGGSPGGTHEGWMMYDNSPGLDDASSRPNVIQRLRPPVAVAGHSSTPGTNTGFDVAFEYPTEFSDSVFGTTICYVGGDATAEAAANYDRRAFAGINIYRLDTSVVDAGTSTPVHYLCGPDMDCSTAADNGWVAFVPLDPTGPVGISIDDPSVESGGHAAGQPYGVEGRGATNPYIIFSDRSVPNMAGSYSYVYQPVLRINDPGLLTDWNGMSVIDVNADGQPEFVDPSGNGLGLTANGATAGGNPIIFVSAEATADGGVTPAEGSIDLSATLDRRGGGVDLSFLSSIEGNVVGFNLYRSTDGSSFIQVNSDTIAAKGTPLSSYAYKDTVNVRRLRSSTLHYKVEALMADGSRATYGPYTVEVGTVPTRERRR